MKKFIKFVTYILMVIVLVIAAVLYIPRLMGLKTYKVLSGSMEPKYHVGSVVYVEKSSIDDIEVGDVITFYINDNTVVTHRVIDKDNDTESFHTKGDANETEDGGSVAYDKVVGKVVLNVPYLGYILR